MPLGIWAKAAILIPLAGVLSLVSLMEPLSQQSDFSLRAAVGNTVTYTLYLPLISKNYPIIQLCRFGVGAGPDIGLYKVNDLRIGWYIDWTATITPARPGGITYMPMIRLRQTGHNSYVYSPSGDALSATIMANQGSLWLIGNEPDRRHWQDNLVPHLYARAYHELYFLIKGIDPSAQIGAGGIVQPTPIRLQYLDMVLQSYQEQAR